MFTPPLPPRDVSPSARRFSDILPTLALVPSPDTVLADEARHRATALGMKLLPRELLVWMAAAQGRLPPRLEHPRVILVAADHAGAPGQEAGATIRAAARIREGQGDLAKLAESVDADVRLYDLGLAEPGPDATAEPAMTEGEATDALLYGMMAVDTGLDVVALGGLGAGREASAAAIARLLGLEDLSLALMPAAEADRVDALCARHAEALGNALELLRRLGGRGVAVMMGILIAASIARTPVALEGPDGLIAALLLHRLAPDAVASCVFVGAGEREPLLRHASDSGLLAIAGDVGDEPGMGVAGLLPVLKATLELMT